MKTIRFYAALTRSTLRELCQRRWLLAELVLLCAALPLCAAPAAQALLSRGVAFSGVTVAVTAPEGDGTPSLLEQYIGNMRDVQQYCTFLAMDRAEAEAALESGEVTAVLVLPENFVRGIMYGSNPDVELLVPGDRPLESLLTLWVGQSAADILAAFQAGVYAVLDLYDAAPPTGLTRDQALVDINLRYINWTLDRQNLFRPEKLSATQALPVPLHYGLSLLAYLGLAAAPLFSGVYSGRRLLTRRRFRCAGRGSAVGYAADLTACALVLFVLAAVPLALLTEASLPAVLAAAAVFALFCAVFGSLCCLATSGAASCGGLAFTLSLAALGAAGGILPPVMLPQTLRQWSWLSPVAGLRALAAAAAGYGPDRPALAAGAAALAGMVLLSALLYHRRVTRQEAAV